MLFQQPDLHYVDGNEFHRPYNSYRKGDRVYLYLGPGEEDAGYWSARISHVEMSMYAPDCVLIYYDDLQYLGTELKMELKIIGETKID